MAGESIHLKVITPIGVILEEEVTSVTLPSGDGEIGILPDHVDYNGLLGVGTLTCQKVGGGAPLNMVVTGGFIQFGENVLTILADTVDVPENVDIAKLTARRAELQATVDNESTYNEGWQYAKDQLARIDAAERLVS